MYRRVVQNGTLSPVFFFFFFSSRRRHTRCSRDWSSDVCSSDLVRLASAESLLWKAGLTSSRYQSQYSCQMKWYIWLEAWSNRYASSDALTSRIVRLRRLRIQRSAKERSFDGAASHGPSRFITMNRAFFQILLAKLR